MPACYYLYGAAGKNKSVLAREVVPAHMLYEKPDNSKFWSTYDGQDVVVINDLRDGDYQWQRMLKLLDRGQFEVEIKGTYVPFLAKVIILTAPMPHDQLFSQFNGQLNDNVDQLTRRLNYGTVPAKGERPCNEYCLDDMSMVDQEHLLHKIRKDLVWLRDPANWDQPKYSVWDGTGDIPEPPPRPFVDDRQPPAPKKPRIFGPPSWVPPSGAPTPELP